MLTYYYIFVHIIIIYICSGRCARGARSVAAAATVSDAAAYLRERGRSDTSNTIHTYIIPKCHACSPKRADAKNTAVGVTRTHKSACVRACVRVVCTHEIISHRAALLAVAHGRIHNRIRRLSVPGKAHTHQNTHARARTNAQICLRGGSGIDVNLSALFTLSEISTSPPLSSSSLTMLRWPLCADK